VGDNRAEKRTMSYEDLKRLESQYELFENKKIFNESIDPKFKTALKWLKNKFSNLTEVIQGNQTYYVDEKGLPLIFYLNDVPIMLINYDRIWALLESIFGFNRLQIQEILKVWLEKVYNLDGFIVHTDWNEIVKWNRPLFLK
jgi:hypothetical protein